MSAANPLKPAMDALLAQIQKEVSDLDDCDGPTYAGEFRKRAEGIEALSSALANLYGISQALNQHH
jgi:hypothetical protein